jgi:hypothetical protein
MITQVYVLTPAMQIATQDSATLLRTAQRALNTDELEMFRLVPVSSQVVSGEVVFKVKASSMSLERIEDILQHNEQLRLQLERCQAVVASMSQMMTVPKLGSEAAVEKLTLRLNKTENENQRLRHLLRTQLIQNERVREETQETIEAIKEEFSALVRDLVKGRAGVSS